MLRLVFCMANEAGLETVLSAAYSLKHETDMKKTFLSREEAFDKAKEDVPDSRPGSEAHQRNTPWASCFL